MSDEYRTHLFSYAHDGARWTIGIQARGTEDARARIGKLAYAHYDGVLIATFPVYLGFLVRLVMGARNASIKAYQLLMGTASI